MIRTSRIAIIFSLIAALLFVPVAGTVYAAETFELEEEEITFGEMAADLIFARPLGAIGCAAGLVGWVLAIPFSWPNREAVTEKMVVEPLHYTFNRPLGDF